MAKSQARANKRKNPKANEDVQNPFIIRATIDNLKRSIRGNNPISDAALRAEIANLEEDLKKAGGGNPNTQRRPASSRPWRR